MKTVWRNYSRMARWGSRREMGGGGAVRVRKTTGRAAAAPYGLVADQRILQLGSAFWSFFTPPSVTSVE